MDSLKEEIERLTGEIKEKDAKAESLRRQKRATQDTSEKAELQEDIDALEADKNKWFEARLKLQEQLAGTARGTGRWGLRSCILAESHLLCAAVMTCACLHASSPVRWQVGRSERLEVLRQLLLLSKTGMQ